MAKYVGLRGLQLTGRLPTIHETHTIIGIRHKYNVYVHSCPRNTCTMRSTKVQTLGAGHALAKHLVGSEDIRHYVEIRA